MKLKRTIKRKSKHRKKPGRNGKTMKRYMKKGGAGLSEAEQADARAYKTIIVDYIERQKINTKIDLEAVKFSLFKEKLEAVSEITDKINGSVDITREELRKLKSIIFFIIKDDVSAYDMFFDENSAGFQIWIDNFLRYLINDSPFENNVIVKIIEGIKKRPYVKTVVDKNHDYFISDVNNLFAAIKQELTDKSKEKPNAINKVIKQTKLKIKSDVEPVPEPGQDTDKDAGENNGKNNDKDAGENTGELMV